MPKFVHIEGFREGSADRLLSPEQLLPDPKLTAEGWERRFTADPQRLSEVTELYAQLGYEVRAEPISIAETGAECEDCHSIVAARFKTIYTRKKKDE